MPLFEYVCSKKNCKTQFEKLVFGDLEDANVRCPKCGAKVKKLLSEFSYEMNGFNSRNGYSRKKD